MILNKITKKIKCDMNGCNQVSEYNFQYKKGMLSHGVNLCKSCINDMYMTIGKHIVPKSPVNILNIEKKKEKKK